MCVCVTRVKGVSKPVKCALEDPFHSLFPFAALFFCLCCVVLCVFASRSFTAHWVCLGIMKSRSCTNAQTTTRSRPPHWFADGGGVAPSFSYQGTVALTHTHTNTRIGDGSCPGGNQPDETKTATAERKMETYRHSISCISSINHAWVASDQRKQKSLDAPVWLDDVRACLCVCVCVYADFRVVLLCAPFELCLFFERHNQSNTDARVTSTVLLYVTRIFQTLQAASRYPFNE